MKTDFRTPTDTHHEFAEDLRHVLVEYQDRLNRTEMLAIVSQMVGFLVSLQNENVTSKEQVIDIVGKNIEEGQRAAAVFSSAGNA